MPSKDCLEIYVFSFSGLTIKNPPSIHLGGFCFYTNLVLINSLDSQNVLFVLFLQLTLGVSLKLFASSPEQEYD
jgi:succinate-acetate transporter protein